MARKSRKRKPRSGYSEKDWEVKGEMFGEGMEGFFKGLKRHFKNNPSSSNTFKHVYIHKSGGHSAIYGLGFIGALIYYISTSTSLWVGFVGLLKAFVWPAILVFEILKFLGI